MLASVARDGSTNDVARKGSLAGPGSATSHVKVTHFLGSRYGDGWRVWNSCPFPATVETLRKPASTGRCGAGSGLTQARRLKNHRQREVERPGVRPQGEARPLRYPDPMARAPSPPSRGDIPISRRS